MLLVSFTFELEWFCDDSTNKISRILFSIESESEMTPNSTIPLYHMKSESKSNRKSIWSYVCGCCGRFFYSYFFFFGWSDFICFIHFDKCYCLHCAGSLLFFFFFCCVVCLFSVALYIVPLDMVRWWRIAERHTKCSVQHLFFSYCRSHHRFRRRRNRSRRLSVSFVVFLRTCELIDFYSLHLFRINFKRPRKPHDWSWTTLVVVFVVVTEKQSVLNAIMYFWRLNIIDSFSNLMLMNQMIIIDITFQFEDEKNRPIIIFCLFLSSFAFDHRKETFISVYICISHLSVCFIWFVCFSNTKYVNIMMRVYIYKSMRSKCILC